MSVAQRRVVITGIGVISPLGCGKQSLWDSLAAGRSGVTLREAPPGDCLPICFTAEARRFQGKIEDFGPLDKEQGKAIRKGLKVMCRECQMGVAAAQWALGDAGLSGGRTDPTRTGITFGADYMISPPDDFSEGIVSCLDGRRDFQFARWPGDGMPKMSPLWLLKYLPNMPASHLAMYNDLRGPNNTLTMREAAANMALAEAYQTIVRGSADVMVVGATGSRTQPMHLVHAVQQEELATADDPARASRPFDRDRTGMVLGEGAGAVILEELGSAQARGATIYAELLAGASSAVVGRNLSARRDRAMVNVLRAVLHAAAVTPDEIGHLHAHGLSTRTCDIDEAQAINEVFAGRRRPLPVLAAKSYFGNLGAGGGMIELAASLLALEHGQLFATLNYERPDAECPLAVVSDGGVPAGSSFINLNVTPQGQASAVLVRRM